MNTRFSRPLIAVDWGTSSLRGARFDALGQRLEERQFARGILTVPPGEFPAVFQSCFGDWMQDATALCLLSGTIASRPGSSHSWCWPSSAKPAGQGQ